MRTLSELRLSIRLLRSQPGLAVLAILAIGVGIGTATAAFTILRGVFLSPLPVPGGDRIVLVWDEHRTRGYNVYISGDELAYRREHATAFESLAGFSSRLVLLDVRGGATGPVRAAFITPNAFPLYGIPAALGRGLIDDDARPGATAVVIIAHDIWRTRFGERRDVIGTGVAIAGETRTIVGVMPAGVRFPMREDIWIPASFDGGSDPTSRVVVFGKLKPGVSPRQAEDELARLSGPRATPENQLADVGQRVIPFTRGVGGAEQTVVLGAAATVLTLLLVVAAANVATIVLARQAVREGEIALRTALGASRGRIVRLLLQESFVLASVGGLLGLGGAFAGLEWFKAATDGLKVLPWWSNVDVNPVVIGFLVLATFAATAGIGLGPALKVTRVSVSDVLKRHAGHVTGLRFGRLSAALVVVQFAVAVAAIGAAATIGRGLLSFSFDDYHLPTEETLIAQIYFGPASVPEGASSDVRRRAWRAHTDASMQRLRRIEAGLRAAQGVRLASVASAFPGNEVDPVQMEIEGGGHRTSRVIEIGEGYFGLLDSPIMAGRDFQPAEHARAAPVAVVNEPFARKYFEGQNPLGRRIRLESADSARPWIEIVGVARDLGVNPGDASRADAVYVPMAPTTVARVAVRTRTDPRELTPLLLSLTGREAPAAQVQWMVTLGEQLAEVRSVFRRIGAALVAVGGLALLLSAASLYAIVSLTVTRRTREIGLRVALGATRREVLRMVLWREARHLSLGALVGLAGAMALLKVVEQIPFDIRPAEPWLTGLFAVLMLGAGLAACACPARRALSIQPIDALRQE